VVDEIVVVAAFLLSRLCFLCTFDICVLLARSEALCADADDEEEEATGM
jgi:hypothetical protein